MDDDDEQRENASRRLRNHEKRFSEFPASSRARAAFTQSEETDSDLAEEAVNLVRREENLHQNSSQSFRPSPPLNLARRSIDHRIRVPIPRGGNEEDESWNLRMEALVQSTRNSLSMLNPLDLHQAPPDYLALYSNRPLNMDMMSALANTADASVSDRSVSSTLLSAPPHYTPTVSLLGAKLTDSPTLARVFASNSIKRKRGEKKPIPDDLKDDRYFERRKRNNMAAKKSRDARKQREDAIAFKASALEKDNALLRTQAMILREEANTLRRSLQRKNENLERNQRRGDYDGDV